MAALDAPRASSRRLLKLDEQARSRSHSALSQPDRCIYRRDPPKRFQGEYRVPVRRIHDGLNTLELPAPSAHPPVQTHPDPVPDRRLLLLHGAPSALSQAGGQNFRVARNLRPEDFDNVAETEDTVEQLSCAALCSRTSFGGRRCSFHRLPPGDRLCFPDPPLLLSRYLVYLTQGEWEPWSTTRRAVAQSHRRLRRLIRLSDIKAMIAVLFLAIMMGTVFQFRDFYPWYLSGAGSLDPFMFIFLNLLISVYPRFPRSGPRRFPIWLPARSGAFRLHRRRGGRLAALTERCALLSRILWWKNITLQTAYVLSIARFVAAGILLFVGWPGSAARFLDAGAAL